MTHVGPHVCVSLLVISLPSVVPTCGAEMLTGVSSANRCGVPDGENVSGEPRSGAGHGACCWPRGQW